MWFRVSTLAWAVWTLTALFVPLLSVVVVAFPDPPVDAGWSVWRWLVPIAIASGVALGLKALLHHLAEHGLLRPQPGLNGLLWFGLHFGAWTLSLTGALLGAAVSQTFASYAQLASTSLVMLALTAPYVPVIRGRRLRSPAATTQA